MKRSELKAIIKEALIEALPSVLLTINEAQKLPTTIAKPSLKENISSTPKFGSTKKKTLNPYGDIEEIRQQVKVPPIEETSDRVDITRGIGILEWFAKEGGPVVTESEFGHTDEDVENLLKKYNLGAINAKS